MLRLLAVVVLLVSCSTLRAAPPNVVLIFADDLGYADLGCFGATKWKTPHLDKLAADGVKFTDFHSSQPVCSASRASLLTGCYANRLGIHGALGPNAKQGLAASETTIASMLKAKGYATGMVGKWHLGRPEQFLPTNRGFDSYLGLPYSNDMWTQRPDLAKPNYPPLPLIDGAKVVNPNVTAADQATLTEQYTKRAEEFIAANKSKPFFLYVAHTFPHVPLFVGEKFKGSSQGGLYGDVIQEIDASVGRILQALDSAGATKNTLVIFTSDNGPWLNYGNHAGSAGKLREGKGTVYEGGHRVPFVARYPGVIPAGATQKEPAMTIDLLPSIAGWCGADLPKLPIDGLDIRPLFRAERGAKSPHEFFAHYYQTNELQAIRSGAWKLMLPHTSRTMKDQAPGADGKPGRYAQEKVALALYDLDADVGETTDVLAKHPEIVERLQGYAERLREDLGDSLTKRVGKNVRKPDVAKE